METLEITNSVDIGRKLVTHTKNQEISTYPKDMHTK